MLPVYNCVYSEFLAMRVGKYKVWRANKDHGVPANFIHDLDTDPGETRAAVVSAGARKYLLSRADTEYARVMRSIDADRKRKSPRVQPSEITCCNPNHYDCHCPFPADGLVTLASEPPTRLTPGAPPPVAADARCGQPARADPPLAATRDASCAPYPPDGRWTAVPACL